MRDILIEFMDSLRDYVAESGTNIAHDERDSSEFVDIFLNQGQSLPIDSVSQQRERLPEFLMKDLDGKIITAYIGGADVTKEWNEYLGNCA